MIECAYCWQSFPPRLTKRGERHSTQPVTCCEDHAKRWSYWNARERRECTEAIYGKRSLAVELYKRMHMQHH